MGIILIEIEAQAILAGGGAFGGIRSVEQQLGKAIGRTGDQVGAAVVVEIAAVEFEPGGVAE
jgi:hypothetical protein